jgi:RNA polymerase subunit RPABC4/transcription elongation factor Spt4
MAEVLVKNEVCEKCGAAVRPNAFFCFNCGSQVVSDEVIAAEEENEDVSSAWFKETITDQKAEPVLKQKIVDKSGIELTPLAIEEKPISKPNIPLSTQDDESKSLKTAASIRKKAKPTSPYKKVEVTWEEPQSAPNVWFLVVGLILLLFAISLVFAMIYIK